MRGPVRPAVRGLARRLGLPRGDSSGALLDWGAVRFYAGYFARRRGRLALFTLGASAQSALAVPMLALVRRAFDEAIPRGDVRGLVLVGVGVLLLRAFGSALALALRATVLRVVKGAAAELRADLATRLYQLPRASYGGADPGELHARLVQESERVDTATDRLLSGALPAVFSGAVLLAVLVALEWRLVLIAAAALPAVWVVGRRSGRRVRDDVAVFRDAFSGFSRGVLFALRHMDLTRLLAHEPAETARQHAAARRLRDAGHRMAMSYAVHAQVQRTVTGVAGIALLVGGGVAVARGRLTVGGFLAFYLAAGMLHGYVEAVLGAVPDAIAGAQSLAALRRVLTDGGEEPYRGTRPPALGGGVAYEGVTFAYAAGAPPVLRDVWLAVAPGANLAVTGRNGAGKSTLLHLLAGLYRPQGGRLTAGGVPYDALDVRALRRQLGVVPQHPQFFDGTARENVTYGRDDVSDEALAEAARLAGADAVVRRLPQGWDTPIGDGAGRLSGGERQRLAIARALLGAPQLLVFDEPTTHLDVDTVRAVMQALVAWPARPALLTITHDPGVVALADEVYTLEAGRLTRAPAEAPPVPVPA